MRLCDLDARYHALSTMITDFVNGGIREPAAQDRCSVVRTRAGPAIGAVAAGVAVVTTSPTEASGAAAGVAMSRVAATAVALCSVW